MDPSTLSGFFDEEEKIAGAALRLLTGVALGSILWRSLSGSKRKEVSQAAQGSPIIIMPPGGNNRDHIMQQSVIRELMKDDPQISHKLGDLLHMP